MLPQHVLLALVSACAAVPLNINLGAYSPALVVGDGEISLGSTASASELMATLASGSTQQGGGGQAAGEGQRQGEQPAQPAQPAGEQPARQGEGEQNGEQKAEENAAKRGNLVRSIESIGKRSPAEEHLAAVEDAMKWIKRDLPGFREALTYAREAMKDQPKVELGSEGAGVGIVVNPGVNVPQGSAAAGTAPKEGKKSKRSDIVAEESESPKMTLVAITEV